MKIAHIPRKRFAQHFLTDSRTAEKIVQFAGIGPEDTVLEIGPGKGILTEHILKMAKQVVAVEIDRDLVGILKEKFANIEKFTLMQTDFLKVDLGNFFSDTEGRIKVVSNIPYNISGQIIDKLIRNRAVISHAVLMVQKEVALRLTAVPGSRDYGLATLNLALCAQSQKVMDIKPGAFFPSPEVMSSIISITFNQYNLYDLKNEKLFREITGAGFRMRRKMIRNTIIPYLVSKGITEQKAHQILDEAGINPTVRPETLHVAAFVALSNTLNDMIAYEACRE